MKPLFSIFLSFLLAVSAQAQFPYSATTGEWLSTNVSGGVTAGAYAGSSTPSSDAVRLGFFAAAASPLPSSLLSGVAIGRHAGYAAEGQQSVFIGHAAGQYAGHGGGDASSAVMLGYLAGRNATQHAPHHAYLSLVIGSQAAHNSHSIQTATIMGAWAGCDAISATGSVIIGFAAGYGSTNATGAVLLGQYAGRSATAAQNCVYIGNQAGYSLSRNHSLVIEGNPTYGQAGTTGLIYGEFDTRTIKFGATRMGFLGAPAVSRQTVTGSRNDGSALASLLYALTLFGFITDATTP